MLTSQFNRPSNLIPLGYADLNANDKPGSAATIIGGTVRAQGGAEGFYIDSFGIRYLRYVQNKRGSALALGDVAIRKADIATFTTLSAATTTRLTKAAAFTANALVGMAVTDSIASVAGAAPEGETALISANTANDLFLDNNFAFSVVPNVADTFQVWSPGWHADAAGAAALAENTLGVVVGASGIDDGNFGWVQFHGYCPLVAVTQVAIAKGAPIITAATAKVATSPTVTIANYNAVIGFAPVAVGSTNSGKFPMFLALASRGGAAV